MGQLINVGAFEQALAETHDVLDLKRLHDRLDAVGRLARRMRVALVDQNRVAELRIRTARKAGEILARTVRRGGNSHGGSSAPLPEGISWNQSSRWQALAKIDEDVLCHYLAEANDSDIEVTVAGFARSAGSGSPGVHFSSATDQWLTPKVIIDAVVEVLGGIDLDPCADDERSVPAARHFTAEVDGLARTWQGKIYMNPPYGRTIPTWVEALVDRFGRNEVEQAIALLPARTDTAWFKLLRDWPRCFIEGRLHFSGHENAAPFPSMTVYLGEDRQRFASVFSSFGDIYARLEVTARR